MKITNDQELALQQNEALRKKTAPADGFGALLADQLDSSQAQGITSQISMASGIFPGSLRGMQGISEETAVLQTNLAAMDMQDAAMRIDSAFSNLEQYAEEIGSSDSDSLKKAYGLLENTSSQVAGLRSTYPGIEKSHPELASMLNELDVMTTTEVFKFNRGDYL